MSLLTLYSSIHLLEQNRRYFNIAILGHQNLEESLDRVVHSGHLVINEDLYRLLTVDKQWFSELPTHS